MKFIVIAILLLSMADAQAQSASPASPTYTIILTDAEAQTVIRGLLELPGKDGVPVIQKIQSQAAEQVRKAEEDAVKEKTPMSNPH